MPSRSMELVGIEVTAVCATPTSIDRARELCEKCGTSAENAYDDYDRMLAEADIDTVNIALPNHLHYPFSLKAMEAGKNVVVEKPFASNDREAQHLADVTRAQGVYLWEAVSTPHQPGLAKIREWLGRIGRVKVVSCNYSQYSRRYDQFREGTVLPAFDPKAAGGAMMDRAGCQWVPGSCGGVLMPYVVFLDLDGTLWEAGVVPNSAREAIAAAQANGHKFLSNTGRSRSEVLT